MPSSSAPPVPEQILAQAARLLAARGFDGVSLQEIADAVGITKPALLYHFSSKDDLRRRVLENLLVYWNEVLPRLLRAATSGEGQFEAVVRESVAFFADDPDRARLLVREVFDRPQEMAELLATHVRPWVEIVCRHIRKGQEQGRVHRDVDAEAYVAAVISMVLCTLATSHCIGALAQPGAGAGEMLARHAREVLRVARSSLFVSTEKPR